MTSHLTYESGAHMTLVSELTVEAFDERIRTVVREELKAFDAYLSGMAGDITRMAGDITNIKTHMELFDTRLNLYDERIKRLGDMQGKLVNVAIDHQARLEQLEKAIIKHD